MVCAGVRHDGVPLSLCIYCYLANYQLSMPSMAFDLLRARSTFWNFMYRYIHIMHGIILYRTGNYCFYLMCVWPPKLLSKYFMYIYIKVQFSFVRMKHIFFIIFIYVIKCNGYIYKVQDYYLQLVLRVYNSLV